MEAQQAQPTGYGAEITSAAATPIGDGSYQVIIVTEIRYKGEVIGRSIFNERHAPVEQPAE